MGGPAPYWSTYSYDASGDRLSEVRHDPTGAGTDTTLSYAYPAAGLPHPHAPTSVTTTSGGTSSTSIYAYDADGNTTSRPQDGNQQTLSWDAEGHLASVTAAGATTSYLYDPDGNRLVTRDATGSTLFLPGGVQVHADTAGTVTSTRYYTFAGQTIAVRTGTGTVEAACPVRAAPNSFRAGTLVLLASGRRAPIGQVRPGDVVMATDPTTGRSHAERVVAVITTTDDTEFTDLTVATPHGPARLTSTWHHPFWDATRQAFTDAATLAVGDELREPDGTLTPVLAVTNYHGHHTTYNLTTDTLHTYYVSASTTPILVPQLRWTLSRGFPGPGLAARPSY